MKSKDEIQKAHDILLALILREVPVNISEADHALMKEHCAVLCWALGEKHHEAGAIFGRRLAAVKKSIEDAGYTMRQAAEPFQGPPPGSPPRN